MSHNETTSLAVSSLATVLAAMLAPSAPCQAAARAQEPTAVSPAHAARLPLAPWQGELLDLAFDAVSRMPLNPHVKNRSRAQAEIVEACFDIDQPDRAVIYSARIADWRRGAGYADYARVCVLRGEVGKAERYLELATDVAKGVAKDANQQAWRTDRVRAKVARTLLLLGRKDEAFAMAAGLEASELGAVGTAVADTLEREDLEAWLDSADRVVESKVFDPVRNVLTSCTRLFDRFYDDEELRAEFERRALVSYQELPLGVRIELVFALIDAALSHGDEPKARELLAKAVELRAALRWHPETEIALDARLAAVTFRCGETEQARERARAALDRFGAQRDEIQNFFRADALVPLAEAFHVLGDDTAAVDTYRRALQEALENPNSRPRGDDLVLVCTSMVRNSVAPDAELLRALHDFADGLGGPANPW